MMEKFSIKTQRIKKKLCSKPNCITIFSKIWCNVEQKISRIYLFLEILVFKMFSLYVSILNVRQQYFSFRPKTISTIYLSQYLFVQSQNSWSHIRHRSSLTLCHLPTNPLLLVNWNCAFGNDKSTIIPYLLFQRVRRKVFIRRVVDTETLLRDEKNNSTARQDNETTKGWIEGTFILKFTGKLQNWWKFLFNSCFKNLQNIFKYLPIRHLSLQFLQHMLRKDNLRRK